MAERRVRGDQWASRSRSSAAAAPTRPSSSRASSTARPPAGRRARPARHRPRAAGDRRRARGRMLDRLGWPGRLTLTSDADAAIDGADFVLIQLRVGGQAARLVDETLPPRSASIGQETTGAGGFAKALRTVPVVLDLAELVGAARRRAPGSSTSRTRSGSSPRRSSTTATGRSACATWRSASSGGSPSASAWRRTRWSSSTSG